MTTAQQTTKGLNLTADEAETVLDITESMVKTGHSVKVSRNDDGLYVHGSKYAACGRCAVITSEGVEWVY